MPPVVVPAAARSYTPPDLRGARRPVRAAPRSRGEPPMGNVPVDAVTIEVIRAALNAAAERMRITMIKTAYNHIISESLDFGCAIFDPDVQMIAQGIGLPVFQGHLGFPIQAAIADRGIEAFREGDVFIHNDPYTGNGNHLNDVAMFAPVFW